MLPAGPVRDYATNVSLLLDQEHRQRHHCRIDPPPPVSQVRCRAQWRDSWDGDRRLPPVDV